MTRFGITLTAVFFFSACGAANTGSGRTTTSISGDSGSGGDASAGGGDAGGSVEPNPDPFVPTGGAHKVVFVHHSTGEHIWGGGAEDAYKALRPDDTITEQLYPSAAYGEWENKPQNYQHLWFGMPDATASDLANRHAEGQESFAQLLAKGDVLVFKHCFDGDAMFPSSTEGAFGQTLEKYKASYEVLKTELRKKTDNIFLVWTVAPLSPSERAHFQAADNVQISLDFRNWVLNEWDEPGDNIFVFDYRLLATRGELSYLAESDAVDPNNEDSHPSDDLSKVIAPCFARRLADVVNGNGDTTSRTGGCTID